MSDQTPEASLAAVEELVAASRDLIIVRYRWVHQTGGKPTTDEDMENANARHYEAAQAVAEVLPTLAADLALAAAVRRMEEHPRILGITGPHPEGATSRWLVRDGDRLIAANSIAAIEEALMGTDYEPAKEAERE